MMNLYGKHSKPDSLHGHQHMYDTDIRFVESLIRSRHHESSKESPKLNNKQLKLLIAQNDPELLFDYIDGTGKPLPAGEEVMRADPSWAYMYARYIVKDKWPKGEKAIRKNKFITKRYNLFLKSIGHPENEYL